MSALAMWAREETLSGSANKVTDKITYSMARQRERRLKAVKAFPLLSSVGAKHVCERSRVLDLPLESVRTTVGQQLVDNIYAKGIWNWFGHHVFRERAGAVFFFPPPSKFWQRSQCLRCHEQTSKGEPGRGDDELRRHRGLLSSNSKALSSSVTSDWLRPLSASSASPSAAPLAHRKCLPLAGHWTDRQAAWGVCWCQAPPCGQANVQNVTLTQWASNDWIFVQDNVEKSQISLKAKCFF